MTVRNWLTRLLNRSNKAEQAFFVSERDKGDYNNLHVHMLIGTNTDMTFKKLSMDLGMFLLETINQSMIVRLYVSM